MAVAYGAQAPHAEVVSLGNSGTRCETPRQLLHSLVHLHRSSYAMRSPVVYLGYETTSLYSTFDR